MGERSRTTKRAASGGQLDSARHVIRFTGEEVATQRALFLRDLLDILVDGAQQATRLQIDGRSTAPGTPPAWLEDAAAFEVEQIHEREILLRAPSLADALSHRSRQLDLFAAAEPSRSCLDYLEDSLDDALAGREDSDRRDSLVADPGSRYSMVLTNPPFGKKSSVMVLTEEGDEAREALTVTREDFWATTSNLRARASAGSTSA